ncbi:MAG: hypothetical protein DCC68_04410 [Planctomycetota bacterium]|nr:MAG: hypothetical protein DCC68_04410 [Planctomycetota bacterium]
MSIENYRWLAALIAAHPDCEVFGRTRLQKEVKLLQRIGFPTHYDYMIHFYGPYSESLHSDIGLLEAFGFIVQTAEPTKEGNPCYKLSAQERPDLPSVAEYRGAIARLHGEPTVVLELAATYDAFRDMGSDHAEAIERLRRKKGAKCDEGNQERALELLESLGLPVA